MLVQIRTEEQVILESRKFAACCWGEGRPATCLVMLDEQGSLVDILYLPSLSGQQLAKRPGLQYNIAEDPKKVHRVHAKTFEGLRILHQLPFCYAVLDPGMKLRSFKV